MRHGLCMLIIGWILTATSVAAQPISRIQLQQIEQSAPIQQRVAVLTKAFDHNKMQSPDFQLLGFTPLEREVILSMVVSHAVEVEYLTAEQAVWLAAISETPNTFFVTEQGNGYEVTKVAYYYRAKARSLVSTWQQELNLLALQLEIEGDELQLASWLSDPEHSYQVRRDMLLSLMPRLSENGLAALTRQFVEANNLLWLPDNALLANLASLSGDIRLYHQLWRRRTDTYSQIELRRLAKKTPSAQTVEQLIGATVNPTLKAQAYRSLIAIKPLPVRAREFLVEKLDELDDGQLVANELVEQGYISWLEQLAQGSTSKVLLRHYQAVSRP